eukprot:TRINITY_DN6627_c0_g1_i1.p3 TRINITY_DN6627_c0_g1~~TRINITY_DN6627_c0_g1_i1.p3  ORF type:complete len:206 (+),score=62.22 TRINITY_DN6627_c0_g1_i1:86-703(+)
MLGRHTAAAVLSAAASAQAAYLRGASRAEESGTMQQVHDVFFDPNGHPTKWFWVAVGVLVLIIILIICCCRSKGVHANAKAVPGQAWVGVELASSAPGTKKTYKGCKVAKVYEDHPSHAGGRGLLENDDLVAVVVDGQEKSLRSDRPGESRQLFKDQMSTRMVGDRVVFRLVRQGKTLEVPVEIVDKSVYKKGVSPPPARGYGAA